MFLPPKLLVAKKLHPSEMGHTQRPLAGFMPSTPFVGQCWACMLGRRTLLKAPAIPCGCPRTRSKDTPGLHTLGSRVVPSGYHIANKMAPNNLRRGENTGWCPLWPRKPIENTPWGKQHRHSEGLSVSRKWKGNSYWRQQQGRTPSLSIR